MTELIAFCTGLIVGWNFIAQPQCVKDLVSKVKDRINNGKT
jgi:hypothetical protein